MIILFYVNYTSTKNKQSPVTYTIVYQLYFKKIKQMKQRKTGTEIRVVVTVEEGVGGGQNGWRGPTVQWQIKLNFWSWARCHVYRSRNTMLNTWNIYNVVNQCYFN